MFFSYLFISYPVILLLFLKSIFYIFLIHLFYINFSLGEMFFFRVKCIPVYIVHPCRPPVPFLFPNRCFKCVRKKPVCPKTFWFCLLFSFICTNNCNVRWNGIKKKNNNIKQNSWYLVVTISLNVETLIEQLSSFTLVLKILVWSCL